VNCVEEFETLLGQASENKSIDSTIFNSDSSRGHTIFRLTIQDSSSDQFGLVNIIDLAGSEKFSGEKMKKLNIPQNKIEKIKKEAIQINKSLGCLRQVFCVLMESRFQKGKNYKNVKI
jgi:hypothetical protein